MSSGRVVQVGAGLVAVVFVVGVVLGVGRLSEPSTYQSSAVVMIDQPRAIAAVPSPGVLEKLSRLRLKYAGLLRTRELQAPIAESVGVAPGVVASTLQVNVSGESLLLQLAGRSADPDRAEAVARAAADQLIAYAEQEQTDAGIPGDQRFAFRVVTPAETARDVTDQRARLAPLVASALGLVVALGAALVARRRL